MAVSQHPYGWWATQHLEKLDKIIVNSRKIKESNDTKIREKGVEVITEIQQPIGHATSDLWPSFGRYTWLE